MRLKVSDFFRLIKVTEIIMYRTGMTNGNFWNVVKQKEDFSELEIYAQLYMDARKLENENNQILLLKIGGPLV